MKPAEEWCEEMFGRNNWVAADTETIKAIQKDATASLLTWAVERWNAEVSNRPLINIHRRTLDDTWRQVIRHAGGNDRELIGPTHDELMACK